MLTFENSRFVILVDGLIYGKTNSKLHKELVNISESVFLDHQKAGNMVTNWVLATDGEYVVVLLDKNSDDILVFNDRLGRLPVYYSQTGELLQIGRASCRERV